MSVTRNLFQGSEKKRERMQYADPDDHYFNSNKRFVNRVTHSYQPQPRIQKYLPRVSPLNNDDEEELITVLKDIITHEREIEDSKIALAQQGDFNMMDAF